MAYGYLKDLSRITASNKILHDKTFNIDKNVKYMTDIKKVLLSDIKNDFSVDYDSVDVVDILDIYRYLMKNHDVK